MSHCKLVITVRKVHKLVLKGHEMHKTVVNVHKVHKLVLKGHKMHKMHKLVLKGHKMHTERQKNIRTIAVFRCKMAFF